MRTQAAVLRTAHGPFTTETVDLTGPGPGEVLVRVAGVGMCHTDLLARHGAPVTRPMVFGHEGAGVVEAVGAGVRTVVPGDHVVLSFDSCGWCRRCLTGDPAYCVEFNSRNLSGVRADGSTPMLDVSGDLVSARWFGQSSFATHAIATERNVVVVDRSLPLTMLGPLGCGIQTGAGSVLLALKVRPGSSIAVFGTGAVGLAAVMAARVAGASEIIAVDLHAGRRQLALELGATRAIDGADPDIAAQIVGWTGGAEFAFDTTGVSSVIATALGSIRERGVCGLVGVGGDILLPGGALGGGRVLTYLMEGDAVPQQFIPQLIGLWQRGRFPFDELIRTYPLDAINDAERDMASGETVKPVLIPDGAQG
ncbi:NAD(P)-dependent alcohol dehydrogenase [Streptomyces sp. SID13031]|uniref:NAD(P)-dependent alcohol dehydrogenase n=1 Tax=Streptomyces sp. SID13031 TaxID=2706046 RepID=UPI0013C9001F|nr:NAD(P)-dependent alcohol dehydrogenase [Streptomyces sp. SID13031]NEA30984.1 NAD(P)-dependent alcohol dehydrogenase [Streptomyces sp. SID13031]